MTKRTYIDILAITGMAFFWPLLRNSVTGFLATCSSDSRFSIVAVSFAAMVFVMLIAFLALPLRNRLDDVIVSRNGILFLSSVSTSLNCAVLIISKIALVPFILVSISLFLVETLFALMSYCWVRFIMEYCQGDQQKMMLIPLASYVLSFIFGYLSYLPDPANWVRPVLGPFITGVCWWICMGYGHPHGSMRYREQMGTGLKQIFSHFMWVLYLVAIILLLVDNFVYCYANSGSFLYAPSSATFFRDTVSMAVAIVLIIGSRSFKQTERFLFFSLSLLAILMVAGLISTALFSDSWLSFGIGIISVSKPSIMLIIFILIVLEIGKCPGRYIQAVSLLFVVPALLAGLIGNGLTVFIESATASSGADFLGTVLLSSGITICLLMLVYLCILVMGLLAPSAASTDDDSTGSMKAEIDSFQEKYRLSQKEKEVLVSLLEGNTFKKVGELLYMSQNTVQSHAKSIYRKTGVHTKQELVDLVRSSEKAGEKGSR